MDELKRILDGQAIEYSITKEVFTGANAEHALGEDL